MTDVSVPQDRITVRDLTIAGCICLAALGYWVWDGKPAAAAQPSPAAQVAVNSPLAERLTNEGNRLYAASNYAAAEALFRAAIAAKPGAALGYCNLGAALIAERRFDEAIASLEKAIALDPALELARNNLNWAVQEKAKRGK
jgi:tetratricopeptide (TPR) repeat protein